MTGRDKRMRNPARLVSRRDQMLMKFRATTYRRVTMRFNSRVIYHARCSIVSQNLARDIADNDINAARWNH